MEWEEVRARLEEEARCMEQPEAQGTAEVAADIRAALQRVKELEGEIARPKHEVLRQLADAVERAASLRQRVEELERQLANTRVSVETAMKAYQNERTAREAAEKRVEELERGGPCCVRTYDRAIAAEAEVRRLTEAVSGTVAQVEEQRRGRERAEAEVRRLEGLIVGADDEYWRVSLLKTGALMAEARRIRKRKGQTDQERIDAKRAEIRKRREAR